MAKNYRQHLIDRHPAENSRDLSPFGPKKISFGNTITSTTTTLEKTQQKRLGVEFENEPIEKALKVSEPGRESIVFEQNTDTADTTAENRDENIRLLPVDDNQASLEAEMQDATLVPTTSVSVVPLPSITTEKLDIIMNDINVLKENVLQLVKSSECETKKVAYIYI